MGNENGNKNLEKLIKQVEESKVIPAGNKKLILEYDAEREAQGIGTNGKVPSSRIHFLRVILALNGKLKKPFKKMTKQDLIAFVNDLGKMKKTNYGKALDLKQLTAKKGEITSPEVRKHFNINRFYSRVLMNNIAKDCPEDFKLKPGRTAPHPRPHTLTFIGKNVKKFKAEEKQRYSVKSLNTFKSQLKCFFKWLDQEDAISWIKIGRDRSKLPKGIYFPVEILKLIEAENNIRNKAIISALYESGARASEFLGLNIGSLKQDKYSYMVVVSGKTGDRPIRLIKSIPYITQWLAVHQFKDDPNAPLWVSNSTRSPEKARFDVNNLNRLLKKSSKQAGFKKNIYPHLMRHSRLTELAKTLTEAELRLFAGWGKDSDMVETYVHLSHRDLDKAILKQEGLLEEEEDVDVLKPKTCEICGKQNSPTDKFCLQCSTPLDIKTALELDKKQELVSKAKERIELIALKEGMEKMMEKMQTLEQRQVKA